MKCYVIKPDGQRCDSTDHLAAECPYNPKGKGRGRRRQFGGQGPSVNYVMSFDELFIDTKSDYSDEEYCPCQSTTATGTGKGYSRTSRHDDLPRSSTDVNYETVFMADIDPENELLSDEATGEVHRIDESSIAAQLDFDELPPLKSSSDEEPPRPRQEQPVTSDDSESDGDFVDNFWSLLMDRCPTLRYEIATRRLDEQRQQVRELVELSTRIQANMRERNRLWRQQLPRFEKPEP